MQYMHVQAMQVENKDWTKLLQRHIQGIQVWLYGSVLEISARSLGRSLPENSARLWGGVNTQNSDQTLGCLGWFCRY